MEQGKYIYCVIDGRLNRRFGRAGKESGIYTIPYKNISAVVSDVPFGKYDPKMLINLTKQNRLDCEWLGNTVINHRNIVKSLFRRYVVIPAPFFTVPRDEKEVKHLLKSNYRKLRESMERFRGRAEMRIRISFKRSEFEQSVREELAGSDRDFMKLYSISRNTGGGKSQLIEGLLSNEARAGSKKKIDEWIRENVPRISAAFRTVSSESKVSNLVKDRDFMSISLSLIHT